MTKLEKRDLSICCQKREGPGKDWEDRTAGLENESDNICRIHYFPIIYRKSC